MGKFIKVFIIYQLQPVSTCASFPYSFPYNLGVTMAQAWPMACSYAFLVDIGFGLGLEHLGVMHLGVLDLKVWKK